MAETLSASGADLARQALAAARATAKNRPASGPRKTRRSMRPSRGEAGDPQGLGGILKRLTAEQGWEGGLGGGNLTDRWTELCPQYAGLVQPVSYDEQTCRLDLRPSTHAYAAQLRILGGQLAKQINDKMGRPVVHTIRVLPVGHVDTPGRPTASDRQQPEPETPVKTRETASPGYRAALESALTHRPGRQPANPYVTEALARQEAALRANRQPEADHRDTYWEIDRLAAAEVDRSEAVRRAAIARKRQEQAGCEPRRLFGAA